MANINHLLGRDPLPASERPLVLVGQWPPLRVIRLNFQQESNNVGLIDIFLKLASAPSWQNIYFFYMEQLIIKVLLYILSLLWEKCNFTLKP